MPSIKYRIGRTWGNNVYEIVDHDEIRQFAHCHTREDAARIVAALEFKVAIYRLLTRIIDPPANDAEALKWIEGLDASREIALDRSLTRDQAELHVDAMTAMILAFEKNADRIPTSTAGVIEQFRAERSRVCKAFDLPDPGDDAETAPERADPWDALIVDSLGISTKPNARTVADAEADGCEDELPF